MKSPLFFLLSWLFCSGVMFAQDDPQATEKEEADPRLQLLDTLREDVEPNLPTDDARRLKRNVSRMGSFHDRWVREAQDFLVANAPLAELYLYDYSRLGRKRLNSRIIDTLLQFKTYRYPNAPIAFIDELSENKEGRRKVLALLRRVLKSNSSSPHREILSKVFGSWGQGIAPAQRLDVALTACEAGFPFRLEDEGAFSSFARKFPQFWVQVIWEELRRCLSSGRRT